MENNKSKLTGKPLNQIIMPGSHDSGTYAINCKSKLTPDTPSIAAIVPCIVASVAKCQKFNIIEQLDFGVRFFDLRISEKKNEQWFVHGMYSVKLSDAFANFSQWLNTHPYEIVILLASFVNMTPNLTDLINLVGQEKIASYPELTPTSIIDDFWKANKNCIIIDNNANSSNVWSNSVINNQWPNRQDAYSLKTWLDNNLPTTYDNNLSVAQVICTPSTGTVLVGGVPSVFAKEINRLISDWFSDWTKKGKKLNIINLDYVGIAPEILSEIIKLNQN